MDECRECGAELPDGANFCQACGAPQNEAAAKALYRYMKRHAQELAESADETSSGSELLTRLGYALGWILVVAGFAVVPNPASGFLVFGGIVALPPIRRILGRQLGQPPGMSRMLLVSLTSAAIGVGVFVLS
ncbi:zinc-ribbon domain-containing protein [Halovenus aranensis]|uniref:Zinc-ribbon domain-containing protein n=1 Tax=Halovenus aranensis TaxID=890420 RepID=A0A1G8Y1P3_9EURY|nr:zinc ribbon domain-containing protein [Halovenus aranensis]SDJ96748.1 zinc-ribbon domain-containing protein [Halovenus aranensis]